MTQLITCFGCFTAWRQCERRRFLREDTATVRSREWSQRHCADINRSRWSLSSFYTLIQCSLRLKIVVFHRFQRFQLYSSVDRKETHFFWCTESQMWYKKAIHQEENNAHHQRDIREGNSSLLIGCFRFSRQCCLCDYLYGMMSFWHLGAHITVFVTLRNYFIN